MKRILIISALILCVIISGCTSTQTSGKPSGTLQFSTSPEGAQIYLDNQYYGTTPSNPFRRIDRWHIPLNSVIPVTRTGMPISR